MLLHNGEIEKLNGMGHYVTVCRIAFSTRALSDTPRQSRNAGKPHLS